MTVRVRFAPSPTGFLHIGGARTALYNWLFARKNDGAFILRIEDTDQKRSIPGAVEAMMASLRWLGLDWDEGPDIGGPHEPYIQSQRTPLYHEWADWLLDNGYAYRCYCTAEELQARREAQREAGGAQGYDRRCRYLSPEEIAAKEAAGLSSVVRFMAPLEGETVVHDAIRGDIVVPNSQISDAVLLKSDGMPTYHLANVVDDHFMEISHILRADEWISSAPLHLNLYEAFGWEPPVLAHLPLVLNPSGSGKLSKRTQAFDDDGREVLVKVEEFRDAGYLPDAVNNFLANVGWSFGDDVEIFTMEEAMPRFELSGINPAPTRLPYDKLDWLNGQYVQQLAPDELAVLVKPYLDAAGHPVDETTLVTLMPAMSVRLKKLTDAEPFLQFLWDEEAVAALTAADLQHKKLPLDAAQRGFEQTRDLVATIEPFDADTLGPALVAIGEGVSLNEKAGPFLGVLRRGVTGQAVSPPLYESMVALGRDRVLERLDTVLTILAADMAAATEND